MVTTNPEGKDRVHNVNIISQELMETPESVRARWPRNVLAEKTVLEARRTIEQILDRRDRRMLIVVGPCSVHDVKSALEYGKKLKEIALKVQDTMFVVMRVYFEKPRTTLGWKGLINDPDLDGTFNISKGMHLARELLLSLAEIGVPTGTEALDPIIPQYLQDLVSWCAVGARTTESQTHREMASGLSTPVGFKNGTDGNIELAINAIQAVAQEHRFFGIDAQGRCTLFRTSGNRYGHLVLRGGRTPNYDPESLERCESMLRLAGQRTIFVVDCSHGNSRKDFHRQPDVFENCIAQRVSGNDCIVGLMLESNLFEGKQAHQKELGKLRYGVSITDGCIGWETTERLLLEAHQALRGNL